MDQEMMQLKEELKEFVQKGQHIIQKMEGGMVGQRMYGMRSNQSSGFVGYNNGSNGSNSGGNSSGYGQREPWMQQGFPQQMPPQMQQGFPQQGFPQQGFPQYPPQYPQQDRMQQMNPLWFL